MFKAEMMVKAKEVVLDNYNLFGVPGGTGSPAQMPFSEEAWETPNQKLLFYYRNAELKRTLLSQ